MRVPISRIVNLDEEVDLAPLSPINKILVAIRKEIREFEFMKRRRNKELEQEFKLKAAREDNVKMQLLFFAYSQLNDNTILKDKGRVCTEVILALPRSFEAEVREVIKHKEFISLTPVILDCDKDLLESFPNIPLLISMKKKG